MPLLRPASIRIMLISVSSFKIIQINCGIYLGSFFPLSETHKELNSRGWLTKNDQNINTLMHISLFGLDHLLLFLFLLPHLGSAAVPKLSHKVWADADWFLRGTNFASIRSQIVSGTSFDNGYLHLISLAISSAANFFPNITGMLHRTCGNRVHTFFVKSKHWPELGLFAFTARIDWRWCSCKSRAHGTLFNCSSKLFYDLGEKRISRLLRRPPYCHRGVQIEAKHSPNAPRGKKRCVK